MSILTYFILLIFLTLQARAKNVISREENFPVKNVETRESEFISILVFTFLHLRVYVRFSLIHHFQFKPQFEE